MPSLLHPDEAFGLPSQQHKRGPALGCNHQQSKKSTSIGSALGERGRANEVVGGISRPVVAEVEGVAPSDEVVRSVTPSSTSQLDVTEERAGRMLDTLSPLRAAVNSRALGLYLCPPFPRTKEKRFYPKTKGGEKLPGVQDIEKAIYSGNKFSSVFCFCRQPLQCHHC